MWAKPTGPGARTRGCGSPAAWEGQEPASQGAWETLSLLGLWQGWEVRAMGALCPTQSQPLFWIKGQTKGLSEVATLLSTRGGPRKPALPGHLPRHFPAAPPPTLPWRGQLGPSHARPGQLCWELMKAVRMYTPAGQGGPEDARRAPSRGRWRS